MSGNWLVLEGFGEEVIYSVLVFALTISLVVWFYVRSQRDYPVVHPDGQHHIDSVRELLAGKFRRDTPRRRYNSEESRCPVCLNDVQYEVETNCGHVFCCKCWVAYRRHGNFLGAVNCPVCRQHVTILFQCFTVNELNPAEGSEEAMELDSLVAEINSYNRRFSGVPRPFVDYLRDLPTISRHLWNEFFSYGGLVYVFRLRILICLVVGFVYLISPLDILPEAVYGLLGLLDDLFVLLLMCIYISIIYRSYIAGRS